MLSRPGRLVRLHGVRQVAFGFAILLAAIVSMAGFVYWETVGYLTRQIDRSLLADTRTMVDGTPASLQERLDPVLARDRRDGRVYGVFSASGGRLAGNVPQLPAGLPEAGRPATLTVGADRDGRIGPRSVRLVTQRLAGGETLLFGRSAETLDEITEIITRALVLALVPALALAVGGGIAVSRASLRRVEAVRLACRDIMRGHLDRRLPIREGGDEIARLSTLVNEMLDEIERLLSEVRGAGEAIAHDLRTPLTRMRARLERTARAVPADAPRLRDDLQHSLAEIDGALATISAILRIAEVEQARRQENFASVDLVELATTLAEFYGPIAEEKGLAFELTQNPVPPVRGDADLLFEAVANLVDNAIKFTPAGGHVRLEVRSAHSGVEIDVQDTGPGIPAADREAVLRRFHRLDRSRHEPGNGLGLSLVVAICRLHEARLTLRDADGPGCRAVIRFEAPPVTGSGAKAPQAAG